MPFTANHYHMSSLSSFYEDKIRSYKDLIQVTQQKLILIALLRLIAFLGLAIVVWFLFRQFSSGLVYIALFFFICFIILVRLTFRLRDRKALWEKLLFVNSNELGLLNGGLNGFGDGQSLLDSEGYLDDLDIFGKASLFHVLNRTTTSHGMGALTGLLRQSLQSGAAIGSHQQAVRVLSPQVDQRQLLTAQGLLTGEKEGNLHSVTDWLSMGSRLYGRKVLLVARWLLAAYNISCVFFYLSTDNYLPLVAGILTAWIFTGYFTPYISRQHMLIGRKQAILDQYAAILAVFNKMESRDSELLQALQTGTGKAHRAIRRLSQLSAFFDQRLNVLVNIFLNSLILYDLQCMAALEKWKEANKEAFAGWIDAVGSIECLNSLAAFAYNNPDYVYPAPVPGERLLIQAEKMAHPLIAAKERVTNDFVIGRDNRLVLVTGSNMSGKTTFLRTMGVNVLLAQCGAPVCATSFSFTPLQLLTSLRVSDSLQEHTSYFMAELKKLQQIIHRLHSGRPALVLIDEILRGTNSEDKTYGSEQFIRKLLRYHCLSLFASHDLSLGKLEEEMPGVISNYCFESVIEEGELHFNYQLEKGVARNRNASFLMHKMEII